MHKLIFSLGTNNGDDIKKLYENNQNKLICVEACKELCDTLKEKFPKATIINKAISDKEKVKLYISDPVKFWYGGGGIWNSTHKEITERLMENIGIEEVKGIKLNEIIDTYGIPYICKIDIEGDDIIAINQLQRNKLPKIITAESECIGNRNIQENEDIKVLDALKNKGYNKFWLVKGDYSSLIEDVDKKISLLDLCDNYNPEEIISLSSAKNYEEIKKLIRSLPRKDLNYKFGFWYDIIASF